jgi:hypothetical protein
MLEAGRATDLMVATRKSIFWLSCRMLLTKLNRVLRANAMARHTLTLELNDRWVKMVRSPVYFVATALMGVSVSLAPLFLYWSAQGKFFPGFEWITVPVCFAIIYCVPGFFFVLGQAAAESLRQQPTQGETGH